MTPIGADDRIRRAVPVLVAGLLWAIVYGLVWGVAWFAFMRSAWYGALATGDRVMPWSEIWSVWAVLNVPLGVATAAYLRQDERKRERELRRERERERERERVAPESTALIAVVLVLWVPMTVGMVGWAWYESLSLALIALDSAVNLVGLAVASVIARARIASPRSWEAPP